MIVDKAINHTKEQPSSQWVQQQEESLLTFFNSDELMLYFIQFEATLLRFETDVYIRKALTVLNPFFSSA